MVFRLPRVLVAGLAALAVAGCSGGSAVSQGNVDGDLGIQGGDGNIVVLGSHHYQVGDVSGTTLTGAHFDLSSLRGKYVVVNFWGSWCAPCHAEEQGFVQAAKDFRNKGVAFVGIDERENSPADGLAFEQQYGASYPSIYDKNETLALEFPHAIPASTPTTIVIGPTGDILAKVTGGIEYTDLRTLVQDALAGKLSA
ncbi:MAG TPA: TlpA disulfide reductase family protein [Mycobacteriales bacterium]|nr:TlpA disulfide reductase family protein [Mycobacteriales bacterium]